MMENKIESRINKDEVKSSCNDEEVIDFYKILIAFGEQKITIIFITFLAIFIGFYVCYTSPIRYIAKTSIVPSNNGTNMGLNMFGTLSGLAGLAGIINNASNKTSEGMLTNYMRSRDFQSHMVDSLKLIEHFGVKNLNEAISQLNSSFDIVNEKKTGLMIIAVENKDPEFAALLANELVVALKNYLRQLDTDMANEKRAYYVKQIMIIRQTLPQLEIEYKIAEKIAGISAATYYNFLGNLPNQITNKEVQIQMLTKFVTLDNPEVKRLNIELWTLKEQLKSQQITSTLDISMSSKTNEKSEKIFHALQLYNSFKIQETLLQGLNQQLEIGNFDDLKQTLSQIQVIDKAVAPLYRSKPDKIKIMTIFFSIGFLIALLIAFIKHKISLFLLEPENSEKLIKLANAWRL